MKTKLSLAANILLIMVFVAVSASAYVLYPAAWPTTMAYYDAHTMSSSWRSAMSYAVSRWENASNFDWRYDSGSINDVYMEYMDGKNGTFATTTFWQYGGWITKFIIRFDDGESWYTGSSSPGTSRVDARSIGVHEFGHALGIDHTQSSRCSVSESSRPTMCTYYKYGKTWARSLETDDENAVAVHYDAVLAPAPPPQSLATGEEGIIVQFSYAEMSLPDRIEAADSVVHGTVTSISPTLWNQDSGLYWEETLFDGEGETTYTALPYYEVELSVIDLPISFRRVEKTIVVTVLGQSPVDSPFAESSVLPGDDIVLFARDGEIAWRGGRHSVFLPVGDPKTSFLRRDLDGLYRELGDTLAEGLSFEDIERGVLFLRFSEE